MCALSDGHRVAGRDLDPWFLPPLTSLAALLLYEVPRPTRTPLARSARSSWAWEASRRLGEGVTSQHFGLTWSRQELRATRVAGWLS